MSNFSDDHCPKAYELMWQSINAPAKINLYFEAIRRLETGFHEIESLASFISLSDKVSARPASTLSLQIKYPIANVASNALDIPADETNLTLRAARLLQRWILARFENAFDKTEILNLKCPAQIEEYLHQVEDSLPVFPGASIILEKRIPSQAGLGGGSSDAAATLILLNDLWKAGFSREELIAGGALLGSDVPMFFKGSPVICRGRGEILSEIPAGNELPTLYLTLVKPKEGCSTPEVYRNCVPSGVRDDRILDRMIGCWRENRLSEFAADLKNRLLEPAMKLSPAVRLLMERFRTLPDPCLGVSMTGSGSACFGICRDLAHARDVARSFSFFDTDYSETIFVAETISAPLTASR